MKRGGDCIASALKELRSSSLKPWCRRQSSMRTATEKLNPRVSPRHALWEFGNDPSEQCDNYLLKRKTVYPELKQVTEALWVDSQHAWLEENLQLAEAVSTSRAAYKPATNCAAGREQNERVASSRLDIRGGNLSNKELVKAVEALDLVVQQGSHLDSSVFYRVLKCCTAQKNLSLGMRVHALIVQSGYQADRFLANHIICMYASHGKLEEAMQVFTTVTDPDAYMWSSIILGHTRHRKPTQALKLYQQMRESSVQPDNHIFVAVLKACAAATDLASGQEVHADVLRSACKPDVFVGNALVDMYAKCGRLEDARRVFDTVPTRNVVTWNSMISGYSQQGLGQEALALYRHMQLEGNVLADTVTFVCLLHACASVRDLHQGKELHAGIQQRGLQADVVIGNSLVNMYIKCSSLVEARSVFDMLPAKDVVTWNAMVAGYAQQGLGQEALTLYGSMQREGITLADGVTFACLLQACSIVGAVHQGKRLHGEIRERGLEADAVVGRSLVDMYAKCGSLEEARQVFDRLPVRDVRTWTALLNGYAEHCDGQTALQCFKGMQQQRVAPNDATFTCLLSACSREGLVTEGRRIFELMVEDHGITPDMYHYNCMIDLFGRSGRLEEAEDLLQTPVLANDVVGWRSLLSACKGHGDIDRGWRCFERVSALEPQDASAYVLMGNIYANAGRWKDVERVESLRNGRGAKKKPGKACIEVKNKVHEFTVGEEAGDVSSKVRSMNLRLRKEGGHVPQTELVLKAVSEQEKEDALCGHAEKLALAYGLLNTPSGSTLLITKNLRMCNDCHSSTKSISRLEKRGIIVRDAHRVHHFKDGSCSCGDRH